MVAGWWGSMVIFRIFFKRVDVHSGAFAKNVVKFWLMSIYDNGARHNVYSWGSAEKPGSKTHTVDLHLGHSSQVEFDSTYDER